MKKDFRKAQRNAFLRKVGALTLGLVVGTAGLFSVFKKTNSAPSTTPASKAPTERVTEKKSLQKQAEKKDAGSYYMGGRSWLLRSGTKEGHEEWKKSQPLLAQQKSKAMRPVENQKSSVRVIPTPRPK